MRGSNIKAFLFILFFSSACEENLPEATNKIATITGNPYSLEKVDLLVDGDSGNPEDPVFLNSSKLFECEVFGNGDLKDESISVYFVFLPTASDTHLIFEGSELRSDELFEEGHLFCTAELLDEDETLIEEMSSQKMKIRLESPAEEAQGRDQSRRRKG